MAEATDARNVVVVVGGVEIGEAERGVVEGEEVVGDVVGVAVGKNDDSQ